MPRYVVQRRLSAEQSQGSGAEGAGGTVVFTETAAKARELGAAKLGLRESQVQVVEYDDISSAVFGQDVPLTQEEAAEIFNQDTSVVPGTWESA